MYLAGNGSRLISFHYCSSLPYYLVLSLCSWSLELSRKAPCTSITFINRFDCRFSSAISFHISAECKSICGLFPDRKLHPAPGIGIYNITQWCIEMNFALGPAVVLSEAISLDVLISRDLSPKPTQHSVIFSSFFSLFYCLFAPPSIWPFCSYLLRRHISIVPQSSFWRTQKCAFSIHYPPLN